MKYKFSNLVVEIVFKNKQNESLMFRYRLYDHTSKDRWCELMEKDRGNQKIYKGGQFFGSAFDDEKNIENMLNLIITALNDHARAIGKENLRIQSEVKAPMNAAFLKELNNTVSSLEANLDFNNNKDINEAIAMFKLAVFRAEQFAGEKTEQGLVHVSVLPCLEKNFIADDEEHFTSEFRFGELYSGNGLNSVFEQPKVLSGSMFLSFENSNKGKKRYVSLGKLISPKTSKREILNQLSQFNRVDSVQFVEEEISEVKELLPAIWPQHQDIFFSLDLVPWLNLNVDFDQPALLNEAQKCINYYKRDESNEWNILELVSEKGEFSVFSRLCPFTMRFLNEITEIEKCGKLWFYILKPGDEITVRHDDQDKDVNYSMIVTLNYSEQSEIWTDLNEDGSKNQYSKKLNCENPGNVLLFNYAKFYTIKNNSDEMQYYIFFNGPLRFTDEQILELCFENNKVNHKGLLKELFLKKVRLNETLDRSNLVNVIKAEGF